MCSGTCTCRNFRTSDADAVVPAFHPGETDRDWPSRNYKSFRREPLKVLGKEPLGKCNTGSVCIFDAALTRLPL